MRIHPSIAGRSIGNPAAVSLDHAPGSGSGKPADGLEPTTVSLQEKRSACRALWLISFSLLIDKVLLCCSSQICGYFPTLC
jgi:hypothetical protein